MPKSANIVKSGRSLGSFFLEIKNFGMQWDEKDKKISSSHIEVKLEYLRAKRKGIYVKNN